MDGRMWASIDEVCALFDSHAGLVVCDFTGYIDEKVVHEFFADRGPFNSTPNDPNQSVIGSSVLCDEPFGSQN